MRAHRLLFISPRRATSLAPIYVALLVLAAVSVLELFVALWLGRTAPAESQPPARQAAPAGQPFDGGLRVPKEPPRQGGRGTWM